jgi:hypothetical protein
VCKQCAGSVERQSLPLMVPKLLPPPLPHPSS